MTLQRVKARCPHCQREYNSGEVDALEEKIIQLKQRWAEAVGVLRTYQRIDISANFVIKQFEREVTNAKNETL
jgi:hypothetical protein